MASCDAYMLCHMFKEISYNDAINSMGLSNGIMSMKYANKDVYMFKARDIESQEELLDRLGIVKEEISINDLFGGKFNDNLEKILIFAPKLILENINNINVDTTQLSLSVSTYKIISIDGDNITLKGIEVNEEEYIKKTSKEELTKLNGLKLKPNMPPLEIYLVKACNCDKTMVLRNILNSMEHCLENYNGESNGEVYWYSGEYGYDYMREQLIEFPKFDKTIQKLFIGTLVAGSNFYYRREYSEALSEFECIDKKWIYELKKCGGLWRKVTRLLMSQFSFGRGYEEKEISLVINQIKEIELKVFKNIRNNILISNNLEVNYEY